MYRIREYKNDDAKTILGWITDERAFRQWSADKYENYPPLPEEINNFYSEIRNNGARQYIFCDDNKDIGHFILRPIDGQSVSTVRIGFIIIDPSVRGKGIGSAMLRYASEFAANRFNCKRITLGVFENNQRAQICYESVGFRQYSESSFDINGENWKCLEMEYIIG